MAKSNKYEEKAEQLAKAIDIAIEAMKLFPPKGYDEKHLIHFMGVYNKWKDEILNPKPQYKNLQSLAYSICDVFTFFQEANGETVEYFWQKIKENNLDFKRENKVIKILKRGKIKDDIEYNFVKDILVIYRQENIINEAEFLQLAKMIDKFEDLLDA